MEPTKKRLAHIPKSSSVLMTVEAIVNRTKSKLSDTGSNPKTKQKEPATKKETTKKTIMKQELRPKLSPTQGSKKVSKAKEEKVLLSGSVFIKRIMTKTTYKTKVNKKDQVVADGGRCLRKRDRSFTYNENMLQDRCYNEAISLDTTPTKNHIKKLKIILKDPPSLKENEGNE